MPKKKPQLVSGGLSSYFYLMVGGTGFEPVTPSL